MGKAVGKMLSLKKSYKSGNRAKSAGGAKWDPGACRLPNPHPPLNPEVHMGSAEGARCPRRRQTPTCLILGQGLDASALPATLHQGPGLSLQEPLLRVLVGPCVDPLLSAQSFDFFLFLVDFLVSILILFWKQTVLWPLSQALQFWGATLTCISSHHPAPLPPGLIRLSLLLWGSFLTGVFLDVLHFLDFPVGSVVKNLPANVGDSGLISGSGRSPGGGNGNPFQYSCLGNPKDRGAWWATVYGICHDWATRTITATAKSLQSCPTLCDPIDGSPPDSPIPGILQARTLEWVAISFSNAWKWKVKVRLPSPVWLLVTPLTAAYQAPTSMGFSRQEYWSGVPLPSLKIIQ